MLGASSYRYRGNRQAQTPREMFKGRALLLLLGAPLWAAGFPFSFSSPKELCRGFSCTDAYNEG